MRSEEITTREAAAVLSVRRQTISNYIKKGYFKYRAIGKEYKIDLQSFNDFVEKSYPKVVELSQLTSAIDEQIKEAKSELASITKFIRSIRALDVICSLKDIFESIISLSDSPREMKMALDYLSGKSIEQIAKDNGLSKERILQLIYRALRRGKAAFEIKLKQFCDAESELDSLKRKVAYLELALDWNHAEIPSLEKEDILLTQVCDCDLSVRALNCLKSAEIYTIGQLVLYRKTDLLQFRNFGKKTLIELEEFLESHGLSFME